MWERIVLNILLIFAFLGGHHAGQPGGMRKNSEEKMGNKRVISPHLWKDEFCSVITCTQEEREGVKILDNSTMPIKGNSSAQLQLVMRFIVWKIHGSLACKSKGFFFLNLMQKCIEIQFLNFNMMMRMTK